MSPLARIRQVAACTALVFLAGPGLAADPPAPAGQAVQGAQSPASAQPAGPVRLAPNTAAQIAHSALLSVEGTATADTLRLTVRRVSDKRLVGSDAITVTVDGRNQAITRESGGGGYEVPISDLRGDQPRDVEIIVAHDGIREILSGKVAVAEGASADSLLRDHKQVAWWILNIVIVLVAALALSRRKG